jgi:hypothetical protein
MIMWVLDYHLGKPLQRIFELASQDESDVALGHRTMQVSYSSPIEVQFADPGTWMDHRPIAEDEVRSIVNRWAKC